MIPLIQDASADDISRYYHGGLVFHNGEPYLLGGRLNNGEYSVVDNTGSKAVPYSELSLTIVPPFYTVGGVYFGHTAQRRVSRTIQYPLDSFEDIKDMMANHDVSCTFNGVSGRINKDFCVKEYRHLSLVEYRGGYIGFFRKGTFHVSSAIIAERLRLVLEKGGLDYVVLV